jgi:hypothetical protein
VPFPRPRTDRQKALIIAIAAAAWVAAMVAYRHFTAPPPPTVYPYTTELLDSTGARVSNSAGPLQLRLDPFTLYRHQPNQRTPFFTINERGYRGGCEARPGQPNVVVLGGSTAFGFDLEAGLEREALPAQLGRLMPDYQLHNAGVVAWLSGQELAEMVHYADELAPRAYVVFDGWNDAFLQAYGRPEVAALGYHWGTFFVIEGQLRKAVGLAAVKPTPGRGPHRNGEVTAEYLKNHERMAAFARARGAVIVFAFQPHGSREQPQSAEGWRDMFLRRYPQFESEYAAQVEAALGQCQKLSLECIDMRTTTAFASSSEGMFLDLVHLTPRGHAAAAMVIADRLTALLARRP